MSKYEKLVEKLFIEKVEVELPKEEYEYKKSIVIGFLDGEKMRMIKISRLLEERETIDASLLNVAAQVLSGMPHGSHTQQDNIELIHKKQKIEDEIISMQMSALELEQLLCCCNELERLVITALYSNRKKDYQISRKYNISERHIWRLKNNAINKMITQSSIFR